MFKFMKSKKGFSLVELMIVVVIMAILVAVAVPIYNSVTDNARKGTCIDYQRQIMSVVGNDLLLKGKTATAANAAKDLELFTISIPTGKTEFDYTAGADLSKVGYANITDVKALFQTIPSCGDDSGVITVKAYAAGAGESYQIKPSCSLAAAKEHIVIDGSAGSATTPKS